MVASKRLPASRVGPLSTFCPLYHSLTVPELWPGPEQVRRTDTLTSRAAPAGKFDPVVR